MRCFETFAYHVVCVCCFFLISIFLVFFLPFPIASSFPSVAHVCVCLCRYAVPLCFLRVSAMFPFATPRRTTEPLKRGVFCLVHRTSHRPSPLLHYLPITAHCGWVRFHFGGNAYARFEFSSYRRTPPPARLAFPASSLGGSNRLAGVGGGRE